MAVNRKRFKRPYWPKHWLSGWPCVACFNGMLALQEDTLDDRVVPGSVDEATGTGNREAIEHRFVAILVCSNPHCSEPYTMSGLLGPALQENEDGCEYVTVYRPTHFDPSPDLFDVPNDLPTDLRKMIRSSVFFLFWSNEAACANAIRSFVEKFLTYKGVRRLRSNTNRRPMMLSQRIEAYRAVDADQAEHLDAIRWIGNSGSHSLDELTRDNLLHAFEILEHVLKTEFQKKADAARRRLVRDINKRKGPMPAKTKRRRRKPTASSSASTP